MRPAVFFSLALVVVLELAHLSHSQYLSPGVNGGPYSGAGGYFNGGVGSMGFLPGSQYGSYGNMGAPAGLYGANLGNTAGNYGYKNPCSVVSCGAGRYCEAVGGPGGPGSSGGSYKCVRFPTTGSESSLIGGIGGTAGLISGPTIFASSGPSGVVSGPSMFASTILSNPKKDRCYDELVYKVPAGSLPNTRGGQRFAQPTACSDRCQSNFQCAAGQICCDSGCGNICFTPETLVINNANSHQAMLPNTYPNYGPNGGNNFGLYGNANSFGNVISYRDLGLYGMRPPGDGEYAAAYSARSVPKGAIEEGRPVGSLPLEKDQ